MQKLTTLAQDKYGQLWLDEAQACAEWLDDAILDIAASADLADELEDLWDDFDDIEDYDSTYDHWVGFVHEHLLLLPIEQASYQGVLLSKDMRSLRLQSCHPDLLTPFNMMLKHCPPLILAQLVASFSIAARIARVQRIGIPDWNPLKASPEPEPSVFFRPSVLKFRNYER